MGGSVVTLLKAVAETKKKRLTTHQGINYFFSEIANELKDKTIHDISAKANSLYQNFYENDLPPDTVKKHLQDIKRFVMRIQTKYNLNGK
ncbi:MAG: PaREP1 family protein [Candidatus Anammoxibacter sp.]